MNVYDTFCEAKGCQASYLQSAPNSAAAIRVLRDLGWLCIQRPTGYQSFCPKHATRRPGTCPECDYRGWVAMHHDTDDADALQHIERCDTCQVFASDDDAYQAAVEEGWRA